MSGALSGKCVVNTRAVCQAGELDVLLRERGAIPVSYPCIDISPPEDTNSLDRELTRLLDGRFDWLVLPSANSVRSLSDRLTTLGLQLPDRPPFATAVIGPATRAIAERELRLTGEVMPANHQASDLAAVIPLVPGQAALIPQSGIAPPALAEALSARGAVVTTVSAYRTGAGRGGVCLTDCLVRGEIDALTFASASAVDGLVTRLTGEGSRLDLLAGILVACIGESTAGRARSHGFHSPIVPVEQTLASLVDVLEGAFSIQSTSKGMVS